MRVGLAGALLLLVVSCAPPRIEVRAAFIDDRLVFVAADPGDADTRMCWREATVVDDRLRPAWKFTAPGTGECGRILPLRYGRAPEGATATVAPRKLETGRLYLLIGDATGSVDGAFSFSRVGERVMVHNIDPDSAAATAVRDAWWRAQQAPG